MILVLLALSHMKQGTSHLENKITRKKVSSWIISKNKKKINQVRKILKKRNNKEKKRSSENDSLATDKTNKIICILGDSMVKRVEEWKLKKSIDKDHNVYVRIYLGAKLKCMKD